MGLVRKPTVKFNRGLRKLLAASDTETEEEGEQRQVEEQQHQQGSRGRRWRQNQRKAGVSIRISDEDGRERRADEADLG